MSADRFGHDRAALVARGWVECECGRTRRVPKAATNEEKVDQTLYLDLYVSGVTGRLRMPDAAAVAAGDNHLCDPVWLRAQVVALRATVVKRDQKLREMGIGLERARARLSAYGDQPKGAPGPFRSKSQARRLAVQRVGQEQQHRAFEEIVADIEPPTGDTMAVVFEDARKSLEANPHLISSEGRSEIARLSATAESEEPAAPIECPCCDNDLTCCGLDEDECTCVEGCPNA